MRLNGIRQISFSVDQGDQVRAVRSIWSRALPQPRQPAFLLGSVGYERGERARRAAGVAGAARR
jgi:hypothetical protein